MGQIQYFASAEACDALSADRSTAKMESFVKHGISS